MVSLWGIYACAFRNYYLINNFQISWYCNSKRHTFRILFDNWGLKITSWIFQEILFAAFYLRCQPPQKLWIWSLDVKTGKKRGVQFIDQNTSEYIFWKIHATMLMTNFIHQNYFQTSGLSHVRKFINRTTVRGSFKTLVQGCQNISFEN